MEPLTALSSLTGRTISIARVRRSIRIASPDLAAAFRRRRRHKVVRDSCLVRDFPVEPGEPQHESFSISRTRTNKNAGLSDRALPALGRRPTDLCATALFSFQGTDASARPVSDRITDRTKGARRQSQRGILYHCVSMMSTSHDTGLSTTVSTAAPSLVHARFSPSRPPGRRPRAPRPCARSTWPGGRAASNRIRRPSSRSRSC